MLTLEILVLTFAGSLVGNEFAIAAFTHPVLTRQTDQVHFAAATALAKVLGRVMPFWYALVAVLTAALALVDHHRTGTWPRWIVASLALWLVSIVYTLTALVPINNRIAAWTEASRPANWKLSRSKWDLLHRWRVLLLGLAFALLATGICLQKSGTL